MMTDMEMLELAAKAAGIEHLGGEYCVSGSELWDIDGKKWWRPLANDGDALRLAVQLGFVVEPGKCWHSHHGPVFGEDVIMGVMAATRRAIVRAAAQIGAQM